MHTLPIIIIIILIVVNIIVVVVIIIIVDVIIIVKTIISCGSRLNTHIGSHSKINLSATGISAIGAFFNECHHHHLNQSHSTVAQ